MSAFDVADYLRVRLRALDLTTTEAARRSGISRQTWHKLLRADISEARLSTLTQVADTLETHPLSMLRIYFSGREQRQAVRVAKDKKQNQQWVAGFVTDVTFPDNSTVVVGQEFEKIWEVANLGTAAWIGWRLQRQDEPLPDGSMPVGVSIPIPDTQPGEHVRLSVRLRAPDSPGTAISHWKCVNAAGEIVFPKLTGLYCMVEVVAV